MKNFKLTEKSSLELENKNILHELLVHQEELRSQNEDLLKAQAEIERSNQKYQELFDMAPVGYLVINVQQTIHDINQTCAKMLGNYKKFIVGKPLFPFVAKECRDKLYAHFKKVWKVGKAYEEIKFMRSDGSSFPAALESILVCDDTGIPSQCRTTLTDITQRVKAENEKRNLENQLHQKQKIDAIGSLAGGLAHDFNNILAVIMGNIDYALLRWEIEKDLHDILLNVLKGANKAKKITQQLLTFAKGGAPIKKLMAIEPLIEETAEFVLRGSNTKCVFQFSKDLMQINGDEGQLNQVLSNLIINADQAMPEGGEVLFHARNIKINSMTSLPLEPGNYVCIQVKDQGIGIDRRHLLKIFDPYFTTKNKGSGLGLSTVYSIVQKHGGHISVESELGKGTSFYIYLPASTKKVSLAKQTEELVLKGEGKILVMDDEESILDMQERLLGWMGYDTVFATDGHQAIELYKEAYQSKEPFDLVILDLTIPGGMGGAKVIKELIKIDPQVKAIVSSGYSNNPVMANYKDYGFSGVLPKGFAMKDISKVIKETLAGKQS
ncbi:multi-sensor hybrid histidine kinase [Candidatus Magnetomorum sp. HK-1]|nr:multi-sensor hybrid histidine kinase [Candidatus Magnetomorum sp. HK-1]